MTHGGVNSRRASDLTGNTLEIDDTFKAKGKMQKRFTQSSLSITTMRLLESSGSENTENYGATAGGFSVRSVKSSVPSV